jgi:hypothetical protein
MSRFSSSIIRIKINRIKGIKGYKIYFDAKKEASN